MTPPLSIPEEHQLDNSVLGVFYGSLLQAGGLWQMLLRFPLQQGSVSCLLPDSCRFDALDYPCFDNDCVLDDDDPCRGESEMLAVKRFLYEHPSHLAVFHADRATADSYSRAASCPGVLATADSHDIYYRPLDPEKDLRRYLLVSGDVTVAQLQLLREIVPTRPFCCLLTRRSSLSESARLSAADLDFFAQHAEYLLIGIFDTRVIATWRRDLTGPWSPDEHSRAPAGSDRVSLDASALWYATQQRLCKGVWGYWFSLFSPQPKVTPWMFAPKDLTFINPALFGSRLAFQERHHSRLDYRVVRERTVEYIKNYLTANTDRYALFSVADSSSFSPLLNIFYMVKTRSGGEMRYNHMFAVVDADHLDEFTKASNAALRPQCWIAAHGRAEIAELSLQPQPLTVLEDRVVSNTDHLIMEVYYKDLYLVCSRN